MSFGALILAGGKSSRMGRDKAFLMHSGTPLLELAVARARDAGAAAVWVSGHPDGDYSAAGCPVLFDEGTPVGPLGGVARGLSVCPHPLLLVMAVDLPRLDATLLRRLVAATEDETGVVPAVAGRLEPLVAVYPRRSLPLLRTLLADGRRAVRDFAEACFREGMAGRLDIAAHDTDRFTNWNTPADARERAGSSGMKLDAAQSPSGLTGANIVT